MLVSVTSLSLKAKNTDTFYSMTISCLSWLPLSVRKNIDTPVVVYEPFCNQSYGGYYTTGTKVLVVVENPDSDIGSTIAHEYMHYLQYIRGSKCGNSDISLFSKHSYNLAINKYFNTAWWEMEALLFESKITPTQLNKFWLHGLVLVDSVDESLEM